MKPIGTSSGSESHFEPLVFPVDACVHNPDSLGPAETHGAGQETMLPGHLTCWFLRPVHPELMILSPQFCFILLGGILGSPCEKLGT